MLQQTQASRVISKYGLFLRRFPTLRALASAPLGEVLRVWSGLGYNRRARDLHRTARSRRGRLPRSAKDLVALPGVGPYTAAAVACFAYGEVLPFADTNIRRVLGRVRLGRTATQPEAERLDALEMPRRAASWHHALMDLGATICTRRAPRCGVCPLYGLCRSRGEDVAPRSRQPRFHGSDRYLRGRIVALLAQARAGLSSQELARRVRGPRAGALTCRLVEEGLVERADGRFRLPA
jgi:A/G-specific adenine glycosylase